MKYDITENLYEYLQGPEAEIGKLRNDQRVIEADILNITNQIAKIDGAMRDPIVGANEELIKIKEALADEIGFLKGKYNEISEDINNLGKANDIDINEKEDLRPGSHIKLKSSGKVGTITAINTVTKSATILSDDGETIEVTITDIEQIDDKIAKGLDDLEKKAKDVEKASMGGEQSEGQKFFGEFSKQALNESFNK